jgi:hypothetical protein
MSALSSTLLRLFLGTFSEGVGLIQGKEQLVKGMNEQVIRQTIIDGMAFAPREDEARRSELV